VQEKYLCGSSVYLANNIFVPDIGGGDQCQTLLCVLEIYKLYIVFALLVHPFLVNILTVVFYWQSSSAAGTGSHFCHR